MTDTFLINVTDGTVEVHRAENTSRNRWKPFAPCTLEEVGIPELQAWKVVQEQIPEGYSLGSVCKLEGDSGLPYLDVALVPIEPPEPTGAEYLKSLPWGTVASAGGSDNFVVLADGLHWIFSQSVWLWGEEGNAWAFGMPQKLASKDNIIILYDPSKAPDEA